MASARSVRRMISIHGEPHDPLPVPALRRAPDDIEPALLGREEFARRVGVGVATVTHWITDGTIYAIPTGLTGRVKKIPAGEVERMKRLHHG